MEGVDPDTLLEWLQTGMGEEREIQMMALEQLCMLLLMSDNIDRCFESCPPRTFLPALCKIFLDEAAPDNVTARAITYYLDVSNECTRRITAVDGAVKAICNRLAVAEMANRASKDLAEQCVKILELIVQRETAAVFDAGGLQCVLTLVRSHGIDVHKDTLHSSMSVVTRLCSKMEPNDISLPECSASLGALLTHDDHKVSESALRCFATLTDRFLRKSLDPAILAEHGNLVVQLLTALSSQQEPPHPASFLSIVISLLSNLCRGSAQITETIVSSELLVPALKYALLNKDERCVSDSLRLADLLLVLLCEGRRALPKNGPSVSSNVAVGGTPTTWSTVRGLSEGQDRTHRNLIDSIRQRDTEALVDAVQSGQVEINFTDDVGQTLLNWSSAFGTTEMVTFLCEKGADVNKGQRSSSLHYAACFGRPDIAKILLSHGANPELRDEEGKTALDKARERIDEGHREVVAVLESPGDFMVANAESTSNTNDPSPAIAQLQQQSPIDGAQPDQTVVRRVLERLLPVFCEIFQKTLVSNVRRSSLNLMRKAIHYISSETLQSMVSNQTNVGTDDQRIAEKIVAVLGSVLDQEDDVDGHSQVLSILKDLLLKDAEFWLEQIIRLGILEKVETLAQLSSSSTSAYCIESSDAIVEIPVQVVGDNTTTSNKINDDGVRRSNTIDPNDDSWQIEMARNYRWKDWRLVKSRDSLFIWCDACALEYSDGSNGWFRFLLDGRLSTMYSSGSPEAGSDNSDTRAEFLEKLQRARAAVPTGTPLYTILSVERASNTITVGNWLLTSVEENELMVTNREGSAQKMTIREDLPGFVFESNRQTRHSFTAESTLGPDFATGWLAKSGRRLRFKTEAQRQKLVDLAREIWHDYLREARTRPREAFIELQHASAIIQSMAESLEKKRQSTGTDELEQLKAALHTVRSSVVKERLLSTFELASSGLVPALLNLLVVVRQLPNCSARSLLCQEFSEGDTFHLLIRKLVSIMESSEKYPQYLYDTPGGSPFGLQLLSRRIRMKLEHKKSCAAVASSNSADQLLDRTGRTLKCEPLATVGQLKSYLLRMVAKQWYDFARNTFEFVRQVNESNEIKPVFRYQSDFDDQGIIYWLGTNGRTSSDWINPASVGVCHVSSSDGTGLPYGRPEDILSRDVNATNCHTHDDKNAWFTIDLGVKMYPSAYTLRHSRGYGRSALRNWILQGSKNGRNWDDLLVHFDDTALGDPGSTATWPITPCDTNEKGPYRYIRIQMNGKNASGQTYYLSLSGFEIYGTVVDVIVSDFPQHPQTFTENKNASATSTEMASALSTNRLLRSSADASSESVHTVASKSSRILRYRGAKNFSRFNQSNLQTPTGRDLPELTTPKETKSTGAPITQKSMSTTNLFDGPSGESGVSVASTNQAASAESLQHQTPSLENLLARSRIYDERIPEAQAESPSITPEPPSDPPSQLGSVQTLNNVPNITNLSADIAPPSSSSNSTVPSMSTDALMHRQVVEEINAKNLANVGTELSRHQTAASSTTASLSSTKPNVQLRPTLPHRSQSHPVQTPAVIQIPAGGATTAPDRSQSYVLTTREAYNELMDMYAEMLRGSTSIHSVQQQQQQQQQSNSSEASDVFVSRLIRSALSSSGSSSHYNSTPASATSNIDPSSQTVSENRNNRRGLIGFGGGLRSRVSNAADVIRTMVIESGGSISGFEVDNIDLEDAPTYREIMPMDENQDELYEDEIDDEENEVDEEGDDDFPPPRDVPVEALASAAAALRRQSTSGNASSQNNSEPKLDWRQLVMGESSSRASTVNNASGGVPTSGGRACAHNSTSSTTGAHRQWDDEFVLKRQFAALIPAFDPRPGRTNVNQTQDVELPPIDAQQQYTGIVDVVPRPIGAAGSRQASRVGAFKEQRITLTIRGPNLPNVKDISVRLDDDDRSIFSFIQKLIQAADWGQKSDKSRRIWEPTYSLLYEEGNTSSHENDDELEKVIRQKTDANAQIIVDQALNVLSELRSISQQNIILDVASDEFISEKLTQKLIQELSDPLVVAARALPDWCDRLVYTYPYLFSTETRSAYLRATAFGTSRAIVWLQIRRDQILEQTRGSSNAPVGSGMAGSRREDHYPEYRVGRIKHERIKVPRDCDQLLETAVRVMHFHASRKSVLEIEYVGEEGTGLGPTLEFYALVAAEFQRKSLGLWLCDDDDAAEQQLEESELDLGEGVKPPGFYVRRSGGLFPAPLPPNTDISRRASELFRVLGIFLAKVLQDGRLVDLPLARPFLKLVVSEQVAEHSDPLLTDICGLDELESIHPIKGRFLKQLTAFVARKRAIQLATDAAITGDDAAAKRRKIDELTLIIDGNPCRIEDLGLTFRLNPTSSVFEFDGYDLIDGGAEIEVTTDNVEDYVEKCTEFFLNTGIREQVIAFRRGFDLVFPLRAMRTFSPNEVQVLLSGDQCPEWTRDDVMNYTEPKLGYTRESAGFLRFVDVLVEMNATERKAFLQFTTGCSSLPPGGLANLHPRLTIVRKVEASDGSYPSVNTCVHYLKLPEYSCKEILRDRLMTATNEKGFHLN